MTNPLNKIKPVQYTWADDKDIAGITAIPLPAFMAEDVSKAYQRDTTSTITFNSGVPLSEPMLSISEDGFYVRGVKVEQDEKEAATVYKAFRRWMVESELRRSW